MAATSDRSGLTHGQLQTLHLAESAQTLTAVGFGPVPAIGSTQIEAVGSGRGVVGASLVGIDELDGLSLLEAGPTADPTADPAHPNGVVSIDHIVAMTPNPDRTQIAFEAQGLEARRVRRFETKDGPRRQTFFWLGDVICEVVGPDDGEGEGEARWWGLALTVRDIDATATWLGDQAGTVKPAVQPGRRVTTLKSDDATTPILFISEHVASA